MAKPLLTEELWLRIEPLIPKRVVSSKGGRPAVPDRAALTGILFVLKTGIPWEYLPGELGCGCGMTCWRRLRDWQQSGVWQKIHEMLLAELRAANAIDFSRAVADSSSVRAVFGGLKPAPIPRIGVRLAPSIISSPMPAVSRWR
jgi:transposase